MYDKLFEKGQIGKVTTKNKLVMSPMGIGLAEMDGSPSDEMIAYYAARAEGGCGLIIPEIARVNDVHGGGMFRQLSVTRDRVIKPLAKMAEAIHKYDSKVFIQLHHPGNEGILALNGGKPLVSASAVPSKASMAETRALENSEVKELIQQFIDGAIRVKKAGCDGVELHAAHGYLLQQFLSPYTNKRTDEYGGSFENRLRMITEIIQGIHKACGEDFPVGVRLTVDEFLEQVGVTEDYIHLDDGVKIAVELEKVGADFIDVSNGNYETGYNVIEPISYPQGWRSYLIKAVKDAVKVPVMGVTVIREPEVAEKLLEDGNQDFIEMGRTWLCDEQWGKKVQEGRANELRKCINCMRCFESLGQGNGKGVPAECAQNPRTARELKYGPLTMDTEHHSVVVVGGGPAGMIAAETLARRGCSVKLFDDQDMLGGTVNQAKKPPLKERMDWVGDYYRAVLPKLGVEINLGKKVSADEIAAINPDAVIVATGSKSVVPKSIKGSDSNNVYMVDEILNDNVDLSGKTVIVAGAGITGLETAEFLQDKGCKVIIVDAVDRPAPNAYYVVVNDVNNRLVKGGVEYKLGNLLTEVKSDSVVIKSVDGDISEEIPADAVVMSLGYKPDRSLADELEEKGFKVEVIGSAKKDGTIAPATRTGYEVGRKLFSDEKEEPDYRTDRATIATLTERPSVMGEQEGIYMAWLTEPEAIERILPPGLKPFPMPVVTLTVTHIKKPNFADSYYETILGVFAMHENTPGAYAVALLLDGPGAEMGTQLGRDYNYIPKKLGANFSLTQEGNVVKASVSRKGVQLIDAEVELGEYNNMLMDGLYKSPAPGVKTSGYGFYYGMNVERDEDGNAVYANGNLQAVGATYDYKSWTPGYAKLKLNSSDNDPFGSLPIVSMIGGAYTHNDLAMTSTKKLQDVDAEEVIEYLFAANFDRTTIKDIDFK